LNLGRLHEAEESLNRASYNLAHYAAAHFELAQLTASQGRWERALEHIERSLRGNADNAQAHAVKALILNRLGRYEQALEVAENIQALDPLDFLSLAERATALFKLGRSAEGDAVLDTLLSLTRLDSENHLELAVRYARCGLFNEAYQVLKELVDRQNQVERISPMVYYYQAYYAHLLGREKEAAELRTKAVQTSPKYCFPSRLESLKVLGWAVEQNPQDARALYYLGNLYYSLHRDEQAIEAWEKAVAIEPANAVAYRNLGYAWKAKGDLQRARTAYEAAVEADPNAAVAIFELEAVYNGLNVPLEEIIAFLEKHLETVSKHDPSLKRLISGYVQTGRYKDALKWLSSHHFKSWEGRYDIHQYWVESHIKQGDLEFEAGNYEKALQHYQLSLTYPRNLEVGEQPHTIHARKRYKIGLALEALGRKKEARKMFEQVVADNPSPESAYQYYRGKALEKLGRKKQARKVYEQLLAAVEGQSGIENAELSPLEMQFDPGRNPVALVHFKRALALEGLGRHAEAEKERRKALELDRIVALRAFSPPRAGW